MRRIVRPVPWITLALVAAACGGGSGSTPTTAASAEVTPPPATTPAATAPAASATAPADPTSPASPTAFSSTTYGYSLAVPAGWRAIQATAEWSGQGMPAHDAVEADQFAGPAAASAWFLGAPTSHDLAAQVQQSIADITADHGDTCPPVPESQDPIEIGGEAAVLLSYDCGILINIAVAVHDGGAYVFGFRDPAVRAATDPVDRETFLRLLDSVTFPG